MAFIEAPTNFYLGRAYNQQEGKLADDVIYYDSRDLTTHAVVVGMTGSGKTGLCISMLEEAILDNIPAIIIDPKGDITNLGLIFPDLQPSDFSPWIHQDDARRAGMDVQTYATDIAQTWHDGLQQWGIVPDRLRWLKGAAQLSIYTPGSDAGLPISILASLRAPRGGWQGQEEIIRERISGLVTALFTLAGMNFKPVKDVEHVLLSNIIEHNWRQGRDLSLEDIVLQIQAPPFDKLGVIPLEQTFPEKKRYKVAMELNNIIASPSFQSWLNGQPLDMQSLLYQPNGRPRVSVFYTAHLNDQERMFITTLLLETMISWMRTLSGTPSLRAILYVDEMFGYFPPYPKNPPTKEPLLRLIKQARAFGIGLVLATQNPGDLDYKGLSNAGTWFIGRLSSENDRKKVMDGLKSMASADESIDLRDVEQMIADITPRVFLMRNVHNDGPPMLMHTRWAMSYLAGPLTRKQISWMMQGQKQQLMAQTAQQHYVGNPQSNFGGQDNQGWTQPHQTGGFNQNQGNFGGPPPPPDFNQNQGNFGGQQQGNFNAPPPPPGFNQNQGNFGGQQQGNFNAPPPPPGFNQNQGNFGGQTGGFNAQNAPNNMGDTGQFDTQRMNTGGTTRSDRLPGDYVQSKPPVSGNTQEYFLPLYLTSQQAFAIYEQRTGQRLPTSGAQVMVAYKPMLIAQTAVRYSEKKGNIYTARNYAFHVPELEARGLIHWEEHVAPHVDSRQLSDDPESGAPVIYAELPLGLQDDKRLRDLERELKDFLYNTARIIVPHHPDFKLYGDPDGDFGNFQSQVYQKAREERDDEIDKLSRKYGGMLDKLEDKLRDKERELGAENLEIRDRNREELFTTGEAIFSLLQGRTNYTLSRMSRATRYKRQAEADIEESHEEITEMRGEIVRLEEEYEQQLNQINNKWAQIAQNIQEHTITPYKKDIHVNLFGVGWVPHFYINAGGQPVVVNAFSQ
jgi:hypothetical protein